MFKFLFFRRSLSRLRASKYSHCNTYIIHTTLTTLNHKPTTPTISTTPTTPTTPTKKRNKNERKKKTQHESFNQIFFAFSFVQKSFHLLLLYFQKLVFFCLFVQLSRLHSIAVGPLLCWKCLCLWIIGLSL